MKQKIDDFKKLLQIALKQKSIKIYTDGRIIIVYKFKPEEMLIDQRKINMLETKLLQKLKAITSIKYKIIKLQKEPAFCYNTYVRLISTSSATSQDKLKSFLKYFRKDKNENFVKTSYKEITITLTPSSKEDFINFLLSSVN